MNKYSTKRSNNSSHSFDPYYHNHNHKHRRDYSPPPSRSHSRSSSPDSLSPRGGGGSSYPSKYSRKSKDRDSSKYYDGSGCSKSKYLRISRSPIGRHGHEHESHSSKSTKNHHHSKDYLYGNGHHHNHHSSTSSSSSSSAAAATTSSSKKFGDWSEQISSSGKIYFYNSKTEKSQWQKPREWLEWEKRHYNNHHSTTSSRYSSSFKHHSSNHRDKYNEIDNNPKSYSYSNNNYDDDDDESDEDDDDDDDDVVVVDSRHHKTPPINHNSSRSHHSERISKSIDHKSISSINDKKSKISNDESATTNHKIQTNVAIPRLQSFNSINCNNSNNMNHNSKLDKQQLKQDSIKINNNNNNLPKKSENMSLRVTSNSSSTTNPSLPQKANDFLSALASIVQQQQSSATGQHSLNFSKIISQIHSNNSHNQGINFPINKTQEEALKFLKKTMQLSQQKSQQINQINQQQSTTKTKPSIQSNLNCRTSSIYHHQHLNHHHSSPNSQSKREHLNNNNTKMMNLNLSRQSLNSSDGIRQDLDQFSKKLLHSSSPSPGPSVNDTQQKSFNNLHRNMNNINNDNNNNVQSVLTTINNSNICQQQQQKNSFSNLSRFKHLYREDLVNHVTGWHSDQLEKQANVLFDQANTTGNHLLTKVSAELKTLRSCVRVTEIQTTLQKHRILFLSEQIKKTEEWKGKQFTNYS